MITPIKKRVITNGGYTSHVDGAVDRAGNEFIVEIFRVKRDGKDNFDAAVKRKIWGSGVWQTIAYFDQPTYGKHSYCAINVAGPHVILYMAQRQPDESTDLIEYHLLNVANDSEPSWRI